LEEFLLLRLSIIFLSVLPQDTALYVERRDEQDLNYFSSIYRLPLSTVERRDEQDLEIFFEKKTTSSIYHLPLYGSLGHRVIDEEESEETLDVSLSPPTSSVQYLLQTHTLPK
jgi:hypothetical protein